MVNYKTKEFAVDGDRIRDAGIDIMEAQEDGEDLRHTEGRPLHVPQGAGRRVLRILRYREGIGDYTRVRSCEKTKQVH